MNREQRRKAEREQARENKKLWPGGYVAVQPAMNLKDGDTFTIQGMRRMKNGHITKTCKPGTETVWTAKVSRETCTLCGATGHTALYCKWKG